MAAAEARARAADEEHGLWGRTVEWLASGFDVSFYGRGFHVEPGADKIQSANLQWNITGQQAWQEWQRVEQAKAELIAAQSRLRNLEIKRSDLTELLVQVDAAESVFHICEAQVEQAKAALERVHEGATTEAIAVADSQVKQAVSAHELLAVQRDKFTIHAPRAGIVTARPANRGEVAIPGSPLLKIADLDQVTLTV